MLRNLFFQNVSPCLVENPHRGRSSALQYPCIISPVIALLRLGVLGIFLWRLNLCGELDARASFNPSPVKISKLNPFNSKKQAGIMWHRQGFFEGNFSIS